MAIFSRRAIQRMLNENAAFLSEKQLERHVSALNRNNFQSLDVEWEVAVLNAFSKIGTVTHEPDLPGTTKKPDLLFAPFTDSTAPFIADVTTVSDEGFEKDIPLLAFEIELGERIKKAGLQRSPFSCSVRAFPHKPFDDIRRPMLPKREEFPDEIFNAAFRNFLEGVRRNPGIAQQHQILTAKTNILITYDPKQMSSTFSCPIYTQAWSKTHNPVYKALRKKAKGQLKKIPHTGPKGIIVCDGSCDLFFRPGHSTIDHFDYNIDDVVREFPRQNKSIAFVLIISSVWNEIYERIVRDARRVQVKIFCNSSFHLLPPAIKSSLLELENHFPTSIHTADRARGRIRRGFDYMKSLADNVTGACEVATTRIKVSARDVLRALAGEVNPDELSDPEGRNTNQNQRFNYFKRFSDKRFPIVGVSLEETPYDDDNLVIEFDSSDPAFSPFINPKAKPDKSSRLSNKLKTG